MQTAPKHTETLDIGQIIKSIGIFSHCAPEFFQKTAESSTTLSCEKNKILFIHGDEAACFYYIRKGWVKLFRETLDGTQAIVDIFTAGHIFGDTSIFEDGRYPYTAEVVEAASLIRLPLAPLKHEIEENSKFAFDMLSGMARYRRQQDREIEHRSLQTAAQRIGCFLLRLTSQNETGNIVIQPPYDKMLVASRLGMQPETFSRALKKLKDETGVEIQGATIKMKSLEQLSDYACAACSSAFPCGDLKSCQ